MHLSRTTKLGLRIATGLTLAFLYAPLIVIAIYAFNGRRTAVWPPPDLSTQWFEKAFHNTGVRDALLTSVKAGLGATALAPVVRARRRPRWGSGRPPRSRRRATASSAARRSRSW